MSGQSTAGIIFEMIVVGRYVKVNAVCTRTGMEVSIVGDPQAPKTELKRIAAQKLQRMLAKKQPKPLNSSGRGIIV